MLLTPSFDNVFPMDAASCLVTEIVGGLHDPQHAAQGACCLLCYGTNFLPTVYKARKTASASTKTLDEVKAEIVTLLKPVTEAKDEGVRATATKAVPWATLLALLVKLLELLG